MEILNNKNIFSTNKLKKMGRKVKADIKDWVEDFKSRESREPNNIEKKEIDHLYKKCGKKNFHQHVLIFTNSAMICER